MKKLLFVLILFAYQNLNAQFAIGLKSMYMYEENDYTDEGDLIRRGFHEGTIKWEFFVESKVINNFYMELGAMKKDYFIGFIPNRIYRQFAGAQQYLSFHSFQIPLLIKYKYWLHKRIYVVPKLGTVIGISRQQPDYSKDKPNPVFDWVTTILEVDLQNDYWKKYYNLYQAGLDMELKFKHSSVIVGFDYIKGFSTLINAKLRYRDRDITNWTKATLFGDGGYVLYSLAYKYNFSL